MSRIIVANAGDSANKSECVCVSMCLAIAARTRAVDPCENPAERIQIFACTTLEPRRIRADKHRLAARRRGNNRPIALTGSVICHALARSRLSRDHADASGYVARSLVRFRGHYVQLSVSSYGLWTVASQAQAGSHPV